MPPGIGWKAAESIDIAGYAGREQRTKDAGREKNCHDTIGRVDLPPTMLN